MDRALSFANTLEDSRETIRTKRLFIAVLWVSLVTTTLTLVQTISQGAPLAAITIAALMLTTLAVLGTMRLRPNSYPAVMHVVVAVSIAVSESLTLLYGGFLESGANAMWGFIAVLGAIVIFEDRRAIGWLAVFVLATWAASVAAAQIEPTYVLPDPEFQAVFNLIVIMVFVFAVLYYYVKQRSLLLKQSDSLLRNILPDPIADRLKTSSEMIADDFEETSILFADVVGFTPMSADMAPTELVALLNDVFSDFDRMVEERGLEKIKTIGDSYMVAAGVPLARDDHAHAICDLALEMQEHARSRTFRGKQLRFRIGVNSGPVVAGIIGRHKFSYDLWGDSVNTASRMESFGVPDRIQITKATHEMVGDAFVCENGGVQDIKGKGPMPVWYLVGRREPGDHAPE